MRSSDELVSLFKAGISSYSKPVRRWVVAHSGGLDSQVLLHLAATVFPTHQLYVVHINHGLQTQADQWSDFSMKQAKKLGIKHQLISVELDGYSENAAREARYQAFETVIRPGDALLVAHHSDDQAETMLFRLLRGAGLVGLSAMQPVRSCGQGVLIRPLLKASRLQLEAWARQKELSWVSDPTNAEDHYDRNFLRNRIMQPLSERWPGFSRRWQHTSEVLTQSNLLLQHYLDQDLSLMLGDRGQLNLSQLPLSNDLRYWPLIRRWFEQQGVLLTKRQQSQVEQQFLVSSDSADPVLVLADRQLRRHQNSLYLITAFIGHRVEQLEKLQVGSFDLGDGQLSVQQLKGGVKHLSGMKIVRRHGGERLRPVGRKGQCSLKKLLQEAHVPSWLRSSWPLLIHGDEIVAVPGICICEGWLAENQGFSLNWRPL